MGAPANPSDAQKDKLRQSDPATQFKRDAEVWEAYLNGPSPTPGSQEHKDVMKRLFMALESNNLQFSGNKDKAFSSMLDANHAQAEGQQMPLASLLSHGGRIILQVPPVEDKKDADKFFQWVVGGKEHIAKDAKQAEKKDLPVFSRPVATHLWL